MADRTLDQQCTVTRPGIAAIASALLVEILVSILQHPQRALAPAPKSPTEDTGDHPLGIVPHQIRGFLSTFQNMVISGKSYDCCSACSETITNAYAKDGWEFVKRALNERDYVEELSGLKEVSVPGRSCLSIHAKEDQVQRTAEKAAAELDFDDDEMDGEDGEGEII